MFDDECSWPEWVEEMYDRDYDRDYEEYHYYLSQCSEDEDWEFLEE